MICREWWKCCNISKLCSNYQLTSSFVTEESFRRLSFDLDSDYPTFPATATSHHKNLLFLQRALKGRRCSRSLFVFTFSYGEGSPLSSVMMARLLLYLELTSLMILRTSEESIWRMRMICSWLLLLLRSIVKLRLSLLKSWECYGDNQWYNVIGNDS